MFVLYTHDDEYQHNLGYVASLQEALDFLATWKDTPEGRGFLWNQDVVAMDRLIHLQPGSTVPEVRERVVLLLAEEDPADEEGPGYRWEWFRSPESVLSG